MLGEIGLEKLEVDCIIGCCEEERTREQSLLMDVKLKVDLGPAAVSDSLSDATDYRQVAVICEQVSQEGRFFLLEALASEILDRLLEIRGVLWAQIKIRKPSALPNAACSFVDLERAGGPR